MSDDGKQYTSDGESATQQVFHERPAGFLGKFQHPYVQVVLLGFVCFMGPGLFNALNGLGAGGQIDSKTSANSNAALYATFAFSAFFAGTINNKLGSKLTLGIGTTGYSLYIGSYLATNIHANAQPFVIVAGVVLGICAGLLWTAQGSLMLAYATEKQKGLFIGIFWGVFNLGGVVGSAVSVSLNVHSTGGAVGNGTYIGFLILTLIGVLIPFTMTPPEKMIRMDGTKVAAPRHPSWKIEFYSLFVALMTDPMILLLFPMFFASNFFYTWTFNAYNGALFNIGARSVNDLVYWSSQIVGSLAMGLLLDQKRLARRVRAFVGWGVLFAVVMLLHIWAFMYQRHYSRDNLPPPIALGTKAYGTHVVLYIFLGMMDAMWQTNAYWMMGAMSNDPAKLAYFVGFYKSIQSAGGAVAWRSDAVKAPYLNLFIATWVLLAAGLLFALPMMFLRIKNTTDLEDETLARMDDSGRIHAVDEVGAVGKVKEKDGVRA